MAWTTALTDLRTNLSDSVNDRLRYRKRVFGDTNGVNKTYKTFEYRRATNLSTAVAPLGVYINGTIVSVTSDDPVTTGEFVLATAPVQNDIVEASYYYQWFTDTELTVFLTNASFWLGGGSDFTLIANGLIPAALKYAMYEAYLKLAIRYAERISEIYRTEDAPDEKEFKVVAGYEALAKTLMSDSLKLRKDFYTRQDQPLAPIFAVSPGNIRDPMPRR